MTKTRRNRALTVGFCGALALTLAACGSGGTASSPTAKQSTGSGSSQAHAPTQATLTSAYQATRSAGSARVALKETATVGGKTVSVTGSGTADLHSAVGSFTLVVAGQQLNVRGTGSELYLELPAADRAKVSGGKPWVSINLAKVAGAKLGSSFAAMVSEGQQGPAHTLAILAQASSTGLHAVGHQTLHGATTTEYAANLDISKLLKASTSNGSVVPLLGSEAAKIGLTTIPVEVWVDGQGRIRQFSEHVNVLASSATHGQSVSLTVTVSLYHFGVPVHVTAPPASQVKDITSEALASAGTTSAGG